MIEAASLNSTAAFRPLAEPPTPQLAGTATATWWTSAPATSAPVVQPTAANDVDTTTRAQQNALLADDVYAATPAPPPGFSVATPQDLDRLGITPEMLEQPGSSFRARVYTTGEGEAARYVVAFRGSAEGEDWRNNAEQALGLNSESYGKALEIGRQIARSDESVTFTGHSLGGGLASAAAIAGGREADTFNAAGLSDRTIETARGIAAANDRGVAAVQAYHVPGEILTGLQEGGDRALGFAFGGIIGGLVADAPEAYGNSITLPDVRPEGKSWFDSLNPIDRHGMDWVIAGTSAL